MSVTAAELFRFPSSRSRSLQHSNMKASLVQSEKGERNVFKRWIHIQFWVAMNCCSKFYTSPEPVNVTKRETKWNTFNSRLVEWELKDLHKFKLGWLHTRPKEFENGARSRSENTSNVFDSVHTTREKFENATALFHFGFVWGEQNSGSEVSWLL